MYYFRGVNGTMNEVVSTRSNLIIRKIRRRRILQRRKIFWKQLQLSRGDPGDTRPDSTASSQYHPSPILGDRLQETKEISEDEKPPNI